MIIGSGGLLSGGKTVTFVRFLKEGQEEGKRIISNIKLVGIPYQFITFEKFIEILQKYRNDQDMLMKIFYNSIMFWDEARNLVSARKSTTNLNEMVTSFLMMAGKLDCDVYYTFQVLTSMIDLQLREITHFFLECERIDEKGQVIIGGKRILEGQKVYIRVKLMQLINDKLEYTGRNFVYDPAPYFKYYNTREIVLLDREKYLTK